MGSASGKLKGLCSKQKPYFANLTSLNCLALKSGVNLSDRLTIIDIYADEKMGEPSAFVTKAIIRKKLPIFIRRLLHNQKENENGGRNTIREELVGCTILMVRGSSLVQGLESWDETVARQSRATFL
ncbi:hypothetical protein MCOR02_003110 [Pyricularia oryzae]|nr:hypothetical protein MCOR02_003110 [Pyricularia oryzae]